MPDVLPPPAIGNHEKAKRHLELGARPVAAGRVVFHNVIPSTKPNAPDRPQPARPLQPAARPVISNECGPHQSHRSDLPTETRPRSDSPAEHSLRERPKRPPCKAVQDRGGRPPINHVVDDGCAGRNMSVPGGVVSTWPIRPTSRYRSPGSSSSHCDSAASMRSCRSSRVMAIRRATRRRCRWCRNTTPWGLQAPRDQRGFDAKRANDSQKKCRMPVLRGRSTPASDLACNQDVGARRRLVHVRVVIVDAAARISVPA